MSETKQLKKAIEEVLPLCAVCGLPIYNVIYATIIIRKGKLYYISDNCEHDIFKGIKWFERSAKEP